MRKDRDKILDLIEENIFKNGLHTTSINFIASSINVSKRTIYKNFRSKDELFLALVDRIIHCITIDLEKIVKENIHTLEKIVLIVGVMKQIAEKFSEKMIVDVRIHYPEMWKRIENFRKEMFDKYISKILLQGIKEGFIIDVPTQIIFTIHQSAIQSIIHTDFLINNNYCLTSAFHFTHRLLLNGLLTEKGRKKLKEINKKRNLGIKIQ